MENKTSIMSVSINQIATSGKYKVRNYDPGTVDRYAEILKNFIEEINIWKSGGAQGDKPKCPFPRPKVIKHDDGKIECITGHHTIQASARVGYKKIAVEIVFGSDQELLCMAIEDNLAHGRGYTDGELHIIVVRLHTECRMSYRKIATIIGFSKSTVENIVKSSKVSKSGQVAKKEPKPFDLQKHLEKFWTGLGKKANITECEIDVVVGSIEGFMLGMGQKNLIKYFHQGLSDMVRHTRNRVFSDNVVREEEEEE